MVQQKVIRIAALLLSLFFFASAALAQDAFDGAVGHGKATRHAYNGGDPTIYKVTNLNDSGTGSLRACAEATGRRVCIPEVSGRINLADRIRVTSGNLWIAGQSAPAPGLTLYGGDIQILSADHVLIEHIRIIGKPFELSNFDGIYCSESSYLYLNHLSIIWVEDEPVSLSNCDHVTIHGLLAQGLGNSGGGASAPSGGEGWGLVMGAQPSSPQVSKPATYVTLFESVIVGTNSRNPKIITGSSVEIANSFFVNVPAGNNGMLVGTKYTGDSGAILIDLREGATLLGPDSLATNYYVGKYSNGPTAGTQIFVDDWLHTDSMSSASAGRRQTDASGNDWDIVNNSQIASGSYQSLSAVISSSLTIQDVDDAYDDVVTSDDSTPDGNAGSRPADRLDLSTEPDYSAMLEAVDPSTSSIKQAASVVVPTYSQNELEFTTPGSPHADAGSGYSNLEVSLKTLRDDVEPSSASGGGTGTPAGGVGDFPQLEAGSPLYSDSDSNALEHTVNFPSTVSAGSLLICVSGCDGIPDTSTPSGFTRGSSGGANEDYGSIHSFWYYKEAVGTEGGGSTTYTTDGSQKCANVCFSFTGWDSTVPPEGDVFSNNGSASADPPSLTASFGSRNNTWIATYSSDESTPTTSAYPTGYENTGNDAPDGTGSIRLAWATKESAAATENPAAYTMSTAEEYLAYTIVVPAGETPVDSEVKYSCGLNGCEEDASGTYDTPNCDGICETPSAPTYDCVNGECTETEDGQYSTLLCNGACNPAPLQCEFTGATRGFFVGQGGYFVDVGS